MSKVSNNSNYNKISLKNDSMVEMIQELSKLGVFKEKRKPRVKKPPAVGGGIRQEGPMPPGFTKDLGGLQFRNLPPIQQITPGMSQQQIDDIQRANDASVAALRAEVEQHRSEQQYTIGGLAGAAEQRFGQIASSLEKIGRQHFRSAQEPDAGIYNPLANLDPNVILLGNEPDTTEESFNQSLNEGGPVSQSMQQTTLYPVEETGNIQSAPAGLQPRAPIETAAGGGGGGGPRKNKSLALRKAVTTSYQLPQIPPFKGTTTADMLEYYKLFTNGVGYDANKTYFSSKEKMFQDINDIADEIAATR